jgi:GTP cyclohydrolase II
MTEPQKTKPIRQIAATKLPTRWGVFRALAFERRHAGQHSPETALVLVLGDASVQAPLVRIHSQCITGDVLGSSVATAASNWNLPCGRSPRKDAVS